MALDPTNTPFSNAAPGSDTYRYANYVKRPAAEAIDAGQAVTVDANGEFKPVQAVDASATNTTWDLVAGVAYISADAGEKVTVKTNGGLVGIAEASVSAGDTCGSSDGTTSSSKGELNPDGDEYFVTQTRAEDVDGDGTNENLVEVIKR